MTARLTNPDLITTLTNQVIPVNLATPIHVGSIEDRSSWRHKTITYDSIWAGGQAIPLVMRYYRSPFTYWQTEDNQKRNREWAILRRLRLDGFPVPRPIARGESEAGAFIIWQGPPGRAWADAQQMLEQAKPLIPQLASLLAHLHNLNHNGLNTEPLYQATVAGTLVRTLLWSREMGNEELRQVIARLKPAVARLKSWKPRLLYGGVLPENVVIHRGEITAIQNWENAAIGDPRWDVMTTAHWLRQKDTILGEQFVNWYETFSGQSIADRSFWWAMVSTRLWALKAWVHYGYKQGLISEDVGVWADDLALTKNRALADLTVAHL